MKRMRKGNVLTELVLPIGISVIGLIGLRSLNLKIDESHRKEKKAEWQRAISCQEAGINLRRVSNYRVLEDVNNDGLDDYLVTEEGKVPRIVYGYNPQASR